MLKYSVHSRSNASFAERGFSGFRVSGTLGNPSILEKALPCAREEAPRPVVQQMCFLGKTQPGLENQKYSSESRS